MNTEKMKPRNRKIELKIKITKEFWAGVAFFVYFAQDAVNSLLSVFVGTGNLRTTCLLFMMYVPVIMIFFSKGEKVTFLDFFVLLSSVALLFYVTYLVHPEYHYWFFEGFYPISDYIFFPTTYLYGYLFIRLFRRPEHLLKCLRYACIVMFVYNSLRLINALDVGYWIIRSSGTLLPKQSTYNLGFGYDMVMILAVFFYYATKSKKKIYYFLSLACCVEILLGGSRGPFLSIAILLIIWFIQNYSELKKVHNIKKMVGIFSISIIIVLTVFFIGIGPIASAISEELQSMGVSSRTITKLIDGSYNDDSGRSLLVTTSLNMIKEGGLFGYGPYGDRYVIGSFMSIGYCHNILFEFCIDFGVIIGSVLFIWVIYKSIKIMFSKPNGDWSILYAILFVSSFKLALSSSFWYCETFWMCIAIIKTVGSKKSNK